MASAPPIDSKSASDSPILIAAFTSFAALRNQCASYAPGTPIHFSFLNPPELPALLIAAQSPGFFFDERVPDENLLSFVLQRGSADSFQYEVLLRLALDIGLTQKDHQRKMMPVMTSMLTALPPPKRLAVIQAYQAILPAVKEYVMGKACVIKAILSIGDFSLFSQLFPAELSELFRLNPPSNPYQLCLDPLKRSDFGEAFFELLLSSALSPEQKDIIAMRVFGFSPPKEFEEGTWPDPAMQYFRHREKEEALFLPGLLLPWHPFYQESVHQQPQAHLDAYTDAFTSQVPANPLWCRERFASTLLRCEEYELFFQFYQRQYEPQEDNEDDRNQNAAFLAQALDAMSDPQRIACFSTGDRYSVLWLAIERMSHFSVALWLHIFEHNQERALRSLFMGKTLLVVKKIEDLCKVIEATKALPETRFACIKSCLGESSWLNEMYQESVDDTFVSHFFKLHFYFYEGVKPDAKELPSDLAARFKHFIGFMFALSGLSEDLNALCRHFAEIAPTGRMTTKYKSLFTAFSSFCQRHPKDRAQITPFFELFKQHWLPIIHPKLGAEAKDQWALLAYCPAGRAAGAAYDERQAHDLAFYREGAQFLACQPHDLPHLIELALTCPELTRDNCRILISFLRPVFAPECINALRNSMEAIVVAVARSRSKPLIKTVLVSLGSRNGLGGLSLSAFAWVMDVFSKAPEISIPMSERLRAWRAPASGAGSSAREDERLLSAALLQKIFGVYHDLESSDPETMCQAALSTLACSPWTLEDYTSVLDFFVENNIIQLTDVAMIPAASPLFPAHFKYQAAEYYTRCEQEFHDPKLKARKGDTTANPAQLMSGFLSNREHFSLLSQLVPLQTPLFFQYYALYTVVENADIDHKSAAPSFAASLLRIPFATFQAEIDQFISRLRPLINKFKPDRPSLFLYEALATVESFLHYHVMITAWAPYITEPPPFSGHMLTGLYRLFDPKNHFNNWKHLAGDAALFDRRNDSFQYRFWQMHGQLIGMLSSSKSPLEDRNIQNGLQQWLGFLAAVLNDTPLPEISTTPLRFFKALCDQYREASAGDKLEIKKCMAQYLGSIQVDLQIGPNLLGHLDVAARALPDGPFESAKARASELVAECARSASPPSAPPLPLSVDDKGARGTVDGGGSGGAGVGCDNLEAVTAFRGALVAPSPEAAFLKQLQSENKERFILAERFIRELSSSETLISMEVIQVLLGPPVLAAISDLANLSAMAKAMLTGLPSQEAALSIAILILSTEPASLSSQVRVAVMPSETTATVACLDWKGGDTRSLPYEV